MRLYMGSKHFAFWTICLLLEISLNVVRSYPTGAPESTCGDMLPHHGAVAQSADTNVYKLQLSATEVAAGSRITVSLVKASPSSPPFKGYLIRAAPVGSTDSTAVGQISTFDNANTKYVSCFKIPQSAITHPNNSPKSNITFEWTAPNEIGNYVILATAVQELSIFWAKFQSPVIKVVGGVEFTALGPEPVPSAPTSNFPVQATSGTNTSSDSLATAIPLMDFDYDVCGISRSCYGFPIDCIIDESCRMIVSYNVVEDKLHVYIVGFTPGYVAFGLSKDQIMGDDSVIECMIPGNVAASVNHRNSNYKAISNASYYTVESTSYSGGTLKCHITRPIKTTVVPVDSNFASITTDLNVEKYYLMLAMGEVNAERTDIEPHGKNDAGASDIMVDLMSSEYLIIGGNNKPALEVIIHGSLMVVAWIGTVSIAIFMARYYKDMWPETMWCSVKIWFAFHRVLNMFTVLFTIAAFVLIFVYKKGFSSIWQENPHPILGCVTMGLAIIQPFGALFRCAPGSSKRPIFNWLHYLLGNATCIVAVVTIFFAVNLSSAHLPKYFWWILIAYIGFYVIMFLVMECLGYVHHRKSEQDVIPMRDYNGHEGSLSSSMHHADKHGSSKFKYVMLFLFIFGVCGFTAALVAVICT